MGENSKIEWCDHTLNFWIGCQEVSAACDNCYAREQNKFRGWVEGWGPHGERRRTKTWDKALTWDRAAAKAGVRARVFSNSLSDFFDKHAPIGARDEAWRLIRRTHNLDWLILTKRPGLIPSMLPEDWGAGYPNVWLGTTVESGQVIKRVWDLLLVPARRHFLSCEPLLSGLTAADGGPRIDDCWKPGDTPHLDWIICGGESGPHRRPINLDHARNLRDYCRASGIAFFMKQIDKVQPIPPDLMIREFPRVAA